MGSLFVGLMIYRANQLQQINLSPCQDLLEPMLSNCLQNITYNFITDNHWTAIMFCVLVLVATLLGYITSKYSHAPLISPIVGLVCGVLLLNIVEPGGRLVAIACFFGYSLGGLITHRKQENRNIKAH
ncbi:MAG: hypothetical protein GY814_15110 [Gammaproteobacteria bacterium]|nr:hypothetical protein [Gammaproteobacteria bacterium]